MKPKTLPDAQLEAAKQKAWDHHGYPAHLNCKVCDGTGYFTHDGGKDACQSCEELFEAEFLSNLESKHELSENQVERP